ncbi:MAG: hypothetical protein ABEJ76_04060 [Halanaeroarchaeum sp.]
MVQTWVYALLAIAVGHLVGTVALYWWLDDDRETQETVDPVSAPDRDSEGDETVVCRRCGTRNDVGFQFCRNCVAELPAGGTRAERGSGPQTRGLG